MDFTFALTPALSPKERECQLHALEDLAVIVAVTALLVIAPKSGQNSSAFVSPKPGRRFTLLGESSPVGFCTTANSHKICSQIESKEKPSGSAGGLAKFDSSGSVGKRVNGCVSCRELRGRE